MSHITLTLPFYKLQYCERYSSFHNPIAKVINAAIPKNVGELNDEKFKYCATYSDEHINLYFNYGTKIKLEFPQVLKDIYTKYNKQQLTDSQLVQLGIVTVNFQILLIS